MSAGHIRYGHHDLHWLLIQKLHRQDGYRDSSYETSHQALFCPYYVTLEGVLGADWGVVVNPESPFFGQLVFEHDWCGCPGDPPEHHSGKWQTMNDPWENRRKRARPRKVNP